MLSEAHPLACEWMDEVEASLSPAVLDQVGVFRLRWTFANGGEGGVGWGTSALSRATLLPPGQL